MEEQQSHHGFKIKTSGVLPIFLYHVQNIQSFFVFTQSLYKQYTGSGKCFVLEKDISIVNNSKLQYLAGFVAQKDNSAD